MSSSAATSQSGFISTSPNKVQLTCSLSLQSSLHDYAHSLLKKITAVEHEPGVKGKPGISHTKWDHSGTNGITYLLSFDIHDLCILHQLHQILK